MLNAEANEIMRKVHMHVPQYEQLLAHMLQEALNDLPSAGLDKVQIFQGRAKLLQELLVDLRHAAGITANRTAKPNFSTP